MSRLTRRELLRTAAIAAPALAFARPGFAAAYPEKDITFIIPYSAGGGFDIYVRAIAPAMESHLPSKVNIVPLNVPAGGGSRGAVQLYRAKPDGYTLAIFNIPGMFVLQKEGDAAYDLAKVTWLGSMGRDDYALAVAANSPIKSVADLKALSATRPVKFTATGPEGTAYAATLIGAKLLGIRTQLITGYKGSNDYVVAAMRGDGDAVVTTLPLLRRMAASDTLRIIATFEKKSSIPGADDATSLGQPELADIVLERLIGAPPKLPADIKATLVTALTQAMTDPQVTDWATKTGVALQLESPDRAAKILADQQKFYDKWKSVLSAS
jgi:tripartite-type tricarboxylate transporter receptor subunit TctC